MMVFVTAMLLLNITPGPDMLYVLARSAGQGRAAGIVSALGIGAGCFFHIFAVAFGLAELLRTVPLAYEVVRWAGAAYLIWLGVRMLLTKGGQQEQTALEPTRLWKIFAQGVLTNVLNPKVALFFLAFLPQFIDPRRPAFGQTVSLGLLFDASGTLVNIVVALAAGSAGSALRKAKAFRFVTGTVFVGLGLRLAFAERR